MRQIVKNIYEYDELTEKAKAKARAEIKKMDSWQDFTDEEASCKAIGEVVGEADWNIDAWNNVSVRFDVDVDCLADLVKGVRFVTWVFNNWIEPNMEGKYYGKLIKRNGHLKNVNYYSKATKEWNCPFTGFCMDMVLKEVYDYMVKKTKEGEVWNLKKFLDELGQRFQKGWQNEIDYRDSDEFIEEMIEANNYEFYENGSLFAEC